MISTSTTVGQSDGIDVLRITHFRLIPCGKDVTKVILKINCGNSSQFLSELGEVHIQLKIKSIFNTGMCDGKIYVYEVYIENQKFDLVPVEKLVSEFKKLQGVTEVEAVTV